MIVTVSVFMGLIIGYSVPPMLETGLIGDKPTVGISTEVSEDLEDYYKNLEAND